jgi:hypothetical protein
LTLLLTEVRNLHEGSLFCNLLAACHLSSLTVSYRTASVPPKSPAFYLPALPPCLYQSLPQAPGHHIHYPISILLSAPEWHSTETIQCLAFSDQLFFSLSNMHFSLISFYQDIVSVHLHGGYSTVIRYSYTMCHDQIRIISPSMSSTVNHLYMLETSVLFCSVILKWITNCCN